MPLIRRHDAAISAMTALRLFAACMPTQAARYSFIFTRQSIELAISRAIVSSQSPTHYTLPASRSAERGFPL
jgi:hypothetical protein